jgi:LysR family transcriptional regulator, glycine cleavage system transcriptional activator
LTDKRSFVIDSDELDSTEALVGMRDLPPLSGLRAFEAAARLLSFKQAADELCVTPSSISHQISGLERSLGTRLFRRFNRKVQLTQEGEALYCATASAFGEIRSVAQRIAACGRRDHAAERLVVAGDPGLLECWLNTRLAGFRSRHPKIGLAVGWGSSHEDYARQNADVAVHYGLTACPGWEVKWQLRAMEFPVCTPEFLHGRPLRRPADLCDVMLLHETSTSAWARWLAAAGAPDVDWTLGPIFGSAWSCFDRALAGEGVALGGEVVAADLIFAGRLVKPLAATRASDYCLSILQPAGREPSPGAARFSAWLIEALQQQSEASAVLRRQEPFPPAVA